MDKRLKILTIFGTRPEAIKMAPIIQTLKKNSKFHAHVCVTGQHRLMLDQVLEFFGIHPDFDLDVMQRGQELTQLTATLLLRIKEILLKTTPNYVLVQGDTTTCLAASLAAFYQKIPVAHVEAGLRSRNKLSPYTEELNRILTGQIADIHFAPTTSARRNLLAEGISSKNIHVTGNTIVDALISLKEVAENPSDHLASLGKIRDIVLDEKPMILVTGHRRESFGEGFKNLCEAIRHLATHYPRWHFIYPVHLNPNVQQVVYKHLSKLDNVHLIEPLPYLQFISLMHQVKFIITDSGGIQEEAPTIGKPVLVTRAVTERQEGVQAGAVIMVGTNKNKIIEVAESLMHDKKRYAKIVQALNLYGDGKAAQRIVDILSTQYVC
jgi:UDP-N-acetylglucosamine 2-epimerase (non-hydrolysing)